ncbi:hypothetical protein FIBSPDRAFT_935339 [Athelia psychrophila]|uniref:Uncharacterized protein n=1 Tax=Athelia psychrophila TaxID=1759441 RepID=A0A166DZY5_9AGAM|nr:hypothetical protein FIBSPDRAFT_935339 [Fibularhizoctonia sp. CBS 109695]
MSLSGSCVLEAGVQRRGVEPRIGFTRRGDRWVQLAGDQAGAAAWIRLLMCAWMRIGGLGVRGRRSLSRLGDVLRGDVCVHAECGGASGVVAELGTRGHLMSEGQLCKRRGPGRSCSVSNWGEDGTRVLGERRLVKLKELKRGNGTELVVMGMFPKHIDVEAHGGYATLRYVEDVHEEGAHANPELKTFVNEYIMAHALVNPNDQPCINLDELLAA